MTFTLPRYTAPTSPRLCWRMRRWRTAPAPRDGVAPEGYHDVHLPRISRGRASGCAAQSRMDCVAVLRAHAKIDVVEFRRTGGDAVFLGRTERGGRHLRARTGLDQPAQTAAETLPFGRGAAGRRHTAADTTRSRSCCNTSTHGRIVWVLGLPPPRLTPGRVPPCLRADRQRLRPRAAGRQRAGHTRSGGAAGWATALGQDIYTQKAHISSHYHHLDVLSAVRNAVQSRIFAAVRRAGRHPARVRARGIPYVLAGSIRDDGPLPKSSPTCHQAQSRMRAQIATATTVICVATQLHSIAVESDARVSRGRWRRAPHVTLHCVGQQSSPSTSCDRGSLRDDADHNAQDFLTRWSIRYRCHRIDSPHGGCLRRAGAVCYNVVTLFCSRRFKMTIRHITETDTTSPTTSDIAFSIPAPQKTMRTIPMPSTAALSALGFDDGGNDHAVTQHGV